MERTDIEPTRMCTWCFSEFVISGILRNSMSLILRFFKVPINLERVIVLFCHKPKFVRLVVFPNGSSVTFFEIKFLLRHLRHDVFVFTVTGKYFPAARLRLSLEILKIPKYGSSPWFARVFDGSISL